VGQRPAGRMDKELALMLAVTRRLPNFPSAGRLAGGLRRVYLRRPRGLVEVDVLGSRMRLDPGECVDAQLLFYPHLRDLPEMRFLRGALRPGDTFLDAGANVGQYALVASQLVGPQGTVLAVEPELLNYSKLCTNIELSAASNVRALRVGLADESGRLSLRLNTTGNRGGNTFLSEDEMRLIPEFQRACQQPDGTYIEDVPVVPLSELLSEQGIRSLAGAKLDIEGYEFRVLKRFLAEAGPALLPAFFIVERGLSWVAGAGGDVVGLLEAHGYRATASAVGSDHRNHIMVQG
jgi:FkbM family methyltransferase